MGLSRFLAKEQTRYLYITKDFLLSRESESPIILEDHITCPRCGATPIRKTPYSDRIKGVDAGAGAAQIEGKTKIDLEPNPQKEEYFVCNGCNFTYVWASLDIKLILEHLRVPPNIAVLVQHYYGKEVTLTDLMTKHCAGIVRSYHSRLNFMSSKLAKRTLYVCFNVNGKRTFGTFKREEEVTNTYTYAMRTLEPPRL